MINEKDQIYKQKFMAFAIRMVKLKNYLNEQKHEYNIADQIQRSGTAIGANQLCLMRVWKIWIKRRYVGL